MLQRCFVSQEQQSEPQYMAVSIWAATSVDGPSSATFSQSKVLAAIEAYYKARGVGWHAWTCLPEVR